MSEEIDDSLDTPAVDEVNFWQPSPDNPFRALQKGELFLFKLPRTNRTGLIEEEVRLISGASNPLGSFLIHHEPSPSEFDLS
jgi:hypothetical protein